MSGKPNTEGVKKVIELLDTVSELDGDIATLQSRIERDSRNLEDMMRKRDKAWNEHCVLMQQMDVEAEGNAGFPQRAAWFLAEMRRQTAGAAKP